MELVIKPALDQALMVERPYKPSGKIRLYPSEAGSCNRASILRINNAPKTKFPLQAAYAMDEGKWYEESTLALLRLHYGTENVIEQLQLQNDFWSGKADFVINHKTEDALVIEHKATGQKWWDYKGSLPKRSHVIQLAMYRDFYYNQFRFVPELRLYYRAWQKWAEFVIEPRDSTIFIYGQLNPEKKGETAPIVREIELPINIKATVGMLEYYYINNKLPKRVKEESMDDAGCTFNGVPSCPFYGNCWPKEASLQEIADKKV